MHLTGDTASGGSALALGGCGYADFAGFCGNGVLHLAPPAVHLVLETDDKALRGRYADQIAHLAGRAVDVHGTLHLADDGVCDGTCGCDRGLARLRQTLVKAHHCINADVLQLIGQHA